MHIGIIGGGAIGLLLSSYLAEAHHITLYVRREEQKSLLNKHGLKLIKKSERQYVQSERLHHLKDHDCMIVCVKQSHIQDVLPYLSEVSIQVPLIFLQNGMSHINKISHLRQPIIIGVTEHGAEKMNDYTVNHTGRGVIKLSPFTSGFDREVQQLIQQLDRDDFPIVQQPDWLALLKGKLVINAVINPLTSLFQVRNGQIIQNDSIRFLARKLCEEACLVLSMEMEEQWAEVQRVANNTAENISSMYNDLTEKRKTEIEAISGYLLDRYSYDDIPYTTFVYRSIKGLEQKRGIVDR